jgi:hypothetical protein
MRSSPTTPCRRAQDLEHRICRVSKWPSATDGQAAAFEAGGEARLGSDRREQWQVEYLGDLVSA